MTAKEIDYKARHDDDIANCTITEAGLFQKLQQLYGQYKQELISVEDAKAEKARLFEEYEAETAKDKQIAELTEQLDRMINAARDDDRRRVKISSLMIEANKYGCDICRKIAKAYDGRIQQ